MVRKTFKKVASRLRKTPKRFASFAKKDVKKTLKFAKRNAGPKDLKRALKKGSKFAKKNLKSKQVKKNLSRKGVKKGLGKLFNKTIPAVDGFINPVTRLTKASRMGGLANSIHGLSSGNPITAAASIHNLSKRAGV